MADEPDNMVLRPLREIPEMQIAQGARFDAMDQRFDERHETIYTAKGFATHAHVRSEASEKRLKLIEDRLEKLEEKA